MEEDDDDEDNEDGEKSSSPGVQTLDALQALCLPKEVLTHGKQQKCQSHRCNNCSANCE